MHNEIYLKGGPNVYIISCFQSCKQHLFLVSWGENYTFWLYFSLLWDLFDFLPSFPFLSGDEMPHPLEEQIWESSLESGKWLNTSKPKEQTLSRWSSKCEAPILLQFHHLQAAAVLILLSVPAWHHNKLFHLLILHVSTLPDKYHPKKRAKYRQKVELIRVKPHFLSCQS